MSTEDYRGSVYAFQRWMREVQHEIENGKRAGVTVIYDKPAPKVRLWDWRRWGRKRA
jgi:hypothetical protein